MRTIRVTGKGQIKVKPDVTRITLKLEGIHKEYSEALKYSSESTEKLKDMLSNYCFEPSDLKTLLFDVDTEYESYKEKDTYKQRLVGYKYTHKLKFEFDSDNERLGKIVYALAHCSLHPEFLISYTVKNPEASKNELLGRAVADAKEKAAVLAKAAGVALKDIETMDYSWGEIDFEFSPMRRGIFERGCVGSLPEEASYNLDIEPDDIEVSDTVTVVWEIGS